MGSYLNIQYLTSARSLELRSEERVLVTLEKLKRGDQKFATANPSVGG